MDKRYLHLLLLLCAAAGLGAYLTLRRPAPPPPPRPPALGEQSLHTVPDHVRLRRIHERELARDVREQPKGSNDSPRIREYQQAAGAPPRTAWCASYAYWAHAQAGIQAYRSAWCPDWARHCSPVQKGRLRLHTPRPSDFILVWSRSQRRYNHITNIHRIEGDYYLTIGGNEGDALSAGRIRRSQVTFIGRYTADL